MAPVRGQSYRKHRCVFAIDRVWIAVCFLFFVRLESACHPIACGPIDRLIHAHQSTLDFARCEHHAPVSSAACGADAASCRIEVNALRREIDRLQTGIVQGFDRPLPSVTANPWGCECFSATEAPSPASHDRHPSHRLPALDDFGLIPGRDSTPPILIDQVVSRLRVTNLGTLLDVLA